MLFTDGGFKVMGEIGPQGVGMSPSDMSVDDFFALAERLDIPVAIHMSSGRGISTPAFRVSAGDPLLLEELLARHPKLRVQVMHAAIRGSTTCWRCSGLTTRSMSILQV